MKFSAVNAMDFISHSAKEFDFILALEVIEHLEDYQLFLKGITHLLRRNGKLMISTPNIFSAEGLVGTFWAKRDNKKFVAWDNSHKKIFKSFEFVNLIKVYNHEFNIEKILGYYFNASDPLPLVKRYIRLPFSSITWFPMNMFGFNIIIIAKKK